MLENQDMIRLSDYQSKRDMLYVEEDKCDGLSPGSSSGLAVGIKADCLTSDLGL